MIRFAALMNGLIYSSALNAKVRLLKDYFQNAPDPDHVWGLAALTRELDFPAVKPADPRSGHRTRGPCAVCLLLRLRR